MPPKKKNKKKVSAHIKSPSGQEKTVLPTPVDDNTGKDEGIIVQGLESGDAESLVVISEAVRPFDEQEHASIDEKPEEDTEEVISKDSVQENDPISEQIEELTTTDGEETDTIIESVIEPISDHSDYANGNFDQEHEDSNTTSSVEDVATDIGVEDTIIETVNIEEEHLDDFPLENGHKTQLVPSKHEEEESIQEPKLLGNDPFAYDISLSDDENDLPEVKKVYEKVSERKAARTKRTNALILEDRIHDLEEENRSLKVKISKFTSELGSLEVSNKSLEEENSLLKLDISELKERLSNNSKWAEDNAVEVRKWKQQVDVLTSELDMAKFYEKKLKESTLTVKSLREELEEALEDKEKSQTEVLNVKKQIDDIKREHAKELSILKKSHEGTIIQANSRIEEERTKGKEAIAFVKSHLKTKIKELEAEFEERRNEENDFRNGRRKLEKDLIKSQEDLENVKLERSKDARVIESLKRQIDLLKDRVDKLTQDKIELEAIKLNVTRTNEELKSEIEVAQSAQRRLESSLKDLVDEELKVAS